MGDRIEILSITLLDQHRPLVEELKTLAARLKISLGWHYLLDLVWIIKQLEPVAGKNFLDAGAGRGLIQWYLAEKNSTILSLDRESRADLSLRFHARYHLEGYRPDELLSPWEVYRANLQRAGNLNEKVATGLRGAAGLALTALPVRAPGKVIIYNHDLGDLSQVPPESQDAVVAVSSLEHNTPDALQAIVPHLLQVIRPGGLLLATLGAAKERDWFHEPSQGWCYSEPTLRRVFGLSDRAPSNFDQFDTLFSALKGCAELRDNLAEIYFQSGNNGMPWGEWDPRYQPVGIRKCKS